MNILIVTDAWHPQVNGVVRTLDATRNKLREMGHNVLVKGPDNGAFFYMRLPGYPEIGLEYFARRRIAALICEFRPDCVHIATEGPLGWAARGACMRRQIPFTTSYHTQFPEYFAARSPRFLRAPVLAAAYTAVRRFHRPAAQIMVATPSIEARLAARGFRHLTRWSRGVDTGQFAPEKTDAALFAGLPRPVLLYVGRVAVEKNIGAFLALDTPGTKVVIGEGPDRARLETAWPQAVFLGRKEGADLARHYASADLFVFPSRTDTFGLVLLEAAAAGLRIAALPAPGPRDIFGNDEAHAFAALDDDLGAAVERALALPAAPETARRFALRYGWGAATEQFVTNLQAQTPAAQKHLRRVRKMLARRWRMRAHAFSSQSTNRSSG